MTLLAAMAFGGGILVLGLVSLVFFVFILVDMIRRPAWQWKQAGSNKAMWITLEVVLFVLFGLLSIVSGIVYLAAARPKLVAAERAGEITGGYGSPWGPGGYGAPGGYGTPPADPYATGAPGGEYPGGAPPAYPGAGQGPPEARWAGPAAAAGEAPPSWQPDPSRRHEFRYWDGTRWTEHVSDAGQQATDPPVA
ncbi:MAG TPA: DUF2510 domain-containing protein [Acidimicrobiales bacterium]|nr:DUF2510 domain-containing protein [Acidimicrobiales bacterium]